MGTPWSPGDQAILDRDPMKIDSVIANPAQPGQPVIVQGDRLDAEHKLLFGDKPVFFGINSMYSRSRDWVSSIDSEGSNNYNDISG
jgi:hypothetical protein